MDVVTTGFLTVSYCVGTPKPCASMESEAACEAQRCSVSKCEDTNSVGPGAALSVPAVLVLLARKAPCSLFHHAPVLPCLVSRA